MGLLDDIPSAINFTPDSIKNNEEKDSRYLLVEVLAGEESKFVLLTGDLAQFQDHTSLLFKFQRDLLIDERYRGVVSVYPSGGGRIVIQPNRVIVYGTSASYGTEKERHTRTKICLEQIFPGYEVHTTPLPRKS